MKVNCFTKSESEMNVLFQGMVGKNARLSKEQMKQLKLLYVSKKSREEKLFEIQMYKINVQLEKLIADHLKEVPDSMIYKVELTPSEMKNKQTTFISYRWANEELLLAKVCCEYETLPDKSVSLRKITLLFPEVEEERWKKVRLKTLF